MVSLYYGSADSGPTYYGGGLLDDTPVLQPEDAGVGLGLGLGLRLGLGLG